MGRLLFAEITIAIVCILLFFPLYLSLNIHYDMNRKKFCFSVCLYKWMKIIGGYITLYSKGIALHVSNKKAILLQYNEFERERKKFSFFQTIRLRKTFIVAETGADYLIGVYFISLVSQLLCAIKQDNTKDVETRIWLAQGDVLQISIKLSWLFNGYTVVKELISVFNEKVRSIWKKKVKKLIG